jgi:hypothetical protein
MKAEYGMSVEVGPNNWKKMNLILDAKDGETPHQLMDRVEDEVESWFAKRFKPSNDLPEDVRQSIINNTRVIPVEKPIPEQERLAIMIGDILKCEKLEGDDGLLSYKSFVDRARKPDITKAYELRLKQLSK